jgi:RNA recognition motif-containing protein
VRFSPGALFEKVKMVYVWCQHLSFETRAEDLQKLFERFGSVAEIKLPLDHLGASRGFCYVLMPDPAAASQAIAALQGSTLHGSRIRVQEVSENSTGLYHSPRLRHSPRFGQ